MADPHHVDAGSGNANPSLLRRTRAPLVRVTKAGRSGYARPTLPVAKAGS
jgi:hypothetical protein